MQVKDVMSRNPVFCTRDANLGEVARLMVVADCGAIPVVENKDNKKLLGIVTDRDIVCRAVAEGKNPLEVTAGDCMSSPVVTVPPEMDVADCCRFMEEKQIRRLAVVDHGGGCCGIVSQADIALHAPEHEVAEVVKEVSQPTETASRAACCG